MLIGKFGFFSSRDTDKYDGIGYDVVDYVPCVKGSFAGRLILEKSIQSTAARICSCWPG